MIGCVSAARSAVFGLAAFSSSLVQALSCPEMPTQARKDVEVQVRTEIAKIGPLKGGELDANVKTITRDLLGKLPDADKVYLEQMMFAAYCSSLQSAAISEEERANRVFEYRKYLSNALKGANGDEPGKGKDKDKDKDNDKPAASNVSEALSIGAFGSSVDDLASKGIQARLIKDDAANRVMATYSSNAFGERWGAIQSLDANRRMGRALLLHVKTHMEIKGDTNNEERRKAVVADCSPGRIGALRARIVEVLGQPHDVSSQSSRRESNKSALGEMRKIIIEGGERWQRNDRSSVVFKWESISSRRVTGMPELMGGETCSIYLCATPANEVACEEVRSLRW